MVPEDLDTRFEVDEVDSNTFTVKGDAEEHRLQFFVVPMTNAVKVSDDEDGPFADEWREFFDIDPYEEVEFEIWFEGQYEEENEFTVVYGFVYFDDHEEGDMGFQQVIESEFEARVKCYDCDEDEEDEQTSSGSGGGGGGGGAAFEPQVQDDGPAEVVEVQEAPEEEDDVVIQDLAGDETAVNEMVVPERRQVVPEISFSSGESAALPEGKGFAMFFLVMLVMTMGMTWMTMQAVKSQEDE